MRIEVVGDGHVFEGTAKQIVMQMKSIAFGVEHLSLREYIDWNVSNIARGFEVKFDILGESDEERATSFIEEMLARGYARML